MISKLPLRCTCTFLHRLLRSGRPIGEVFGAEHVFKTGGILVESKSSNVKYNQNQDQCNLTRDMITPFVEAGNEAEDYL